MQITLNDQLTAQTDIRSFDISYKITSLASEKHCPEQGKMYEIIQGNAKSHLQNTGLIGLISHCYSNHLPLAIAPHDMWVIILSEITKEVADNSDKYRSLFTTSDKKETINVHSGSMTEMPMGVLAKALADKVLFDSGMIFQNFTTETPVVTQTIQAIFCDMASPYYDYMMFCCGIPKIQLLGTTEDWQKVLNGFNTIVETFRTQNLKNYFDKVRPILEQFVNASQGQVDIAFWKDIFTQENVGSGGDLTITGWTTQLFMKEHDFAKITNFTGTHGVVKYKQMESNEDFVAVYGGFNTQQTPEGFTQLEYYHYTLQVVPHSYR